MPQLSCDTDFADYSERCQTPCSRLCEWGDTSASTGSCLRKKWVSNSNRISETAANKDSRELRQPSPLAEEDLVEIATVLDRYYSLR